MAMSMSRPDPSSPASIADATFATGRRGFDQTEVKDFLRMVAAEFGRLREREKFLERELQLAHANPDLRSAPVDEEAMTRLLGEESVRVLTTARESAAEIRAKAEQAAAQMVAEASADAARVREEADIEASRRRSDAAADAEAELAMAKQQGREMVNEARAYRERVLSELARRRELAREQIEQLIHGRDRLLQAFERARLVAVDVVAELHPLGEPDEYVNLAPTTGPLPVMIANSPRPNDSMAIVERPVEGPAALEAVDAGDESTAGDEAVEAIADTAPDTAELVDDVAEVDDTDADAEDDFATADDVVDDFATADDVVDDSATDDDDDAVDDVAPVDAPIEIADEAVDHAGSDDRRDDVVVDLFARLRAGVVSEAADDDDASEAADTTAEAPEGLTVIGAGLAQVVGADEGVEVGEGDPTPFELRDAEITPLIVACARKLKRVLADEQNDVLDALRRSEPVQQLDTLLPWASEHSARYAAAIADELGAAVQAGSVTSLDRGRSLPATHAADALEAANDVLAQWLVTPLRDRLATCIAEGAGDNGVITKKVRAAYREWKTLHIDESLDDIVRTAHGRGVLAGFVLDTPIVWEVDERFPACADCDDNALAGAVAAGSPFPTGHVFAPAHPGCRCLLAAADR